MTTHILAIDPGSVSGAVAIFTDNGNPIVGDLAVADRQVDAAYLTRLLRDMKPKAVVVERVHSMPKQGISSTFRFGEAYGIIQGCVTGAGIPLHLVTPNEWKRGMRLIGKEKDAARALAIRLFPEVVGLHLKKYGGRADALLMGHYWMLEHQPFRAMATAALWAEGNGDDYD